MIRNNQTMKREVNQQVKTQRLTSFQVFMKFVSRDDTGVLQEENVVSEECFLLWVKSRRGTVKHPQDSFRRAVIAHLRGADSRNPFPADVETSILNKLRSSTTGDGDVFKKCFRNAPKKRPKLYKSWQTRYRKLIGFHEAGKSRAKSKRKSKPRKSVISDVDSELCGSTLEELHFLKEESAEEILEHRVTYLRKYGLDLCIPAIEYLLNTAVDELKTLRRNFVLLNREECSFSNIAPVMTIISDAHTGEIEYMDEITEETLGDVPNIFYVFPSTVEYYQINKWMLPILQEKGEVWFRTIVWTRENPILVKWLKKKGQDGKHIMYGQVQADVDIEMSDYKVMLF
eukprot:maker-scaffold_7-snap-gene-12.45-mRNA-1 protein AED:0.03 eAED:0.03 QI:117/1/1/1/1/1/4/96/342